MMLFFDLIDCGYLVIGMLIGAIVMEVINNA